MCSPCVQLHSVQCVQLHSTSPEQAIAGSLASAMLLLGLASFRTMLRPNSVSRLLRSLCLSCALARLPSLFLVYSFHGRTSPSRSSVAVLNQKSISPDVAFQAGNNGLRPRYRFSSYVEYLQLQLNRTHNAKLRKVWSTSDWRRNVFNVFSPLFRWLLDHGLVERDHKVMCIGARMGQEVVAFKEIGVADAIGIDLVPALPLVIQGDVHHHPFADSTFEFEFRTFLTTPCSRSCLFPRSNAL